MASKLKILMVAWIALGFLAVPFSVMAGPALPQGSNDWAIVGVPKGWAPKQEGQTSGPKSGGKKFPPVNNDVAIVGVPGGWKPSTEASTWGSSGSIASRTTGNDRAIVGVPGPWKPK